MSINTHLQMTLMFFNVFYENIALYPIKLVIKTTQLKAVMSCLGITKCYLLQNFLSQPGAYKILHNMT